MASDSDVDDRARAGVERAAPGEVRVRRALLSVSDKRGHRRLRARAWRSSASRSSRPAAPPASSPSAGIAVRAIEDFTGFPEIMDGRVKTLHPRLYAGLLARRDDDAHLRAARRAGDRAGRPRVREPLPVRADRRARRRRPSRRSIENIDIGGPTMIRAAAKNSDFAAVRRRPGRLRAGARRAARVRRAAVARHAHAARRARRSRCTARYDAAISTWFARAHLRGLPADAGATPTRRSADLRYGENPHQQRRLLRARRRADAPARRRRRSCTARSCRSTTCSTSARRAG